MPKRRETHLLGYYVAYWATRTWKNQLVSKNAKKKKPHLPVIPKQRETHHLGSISFQVTAECRILIVSQYNLNAQTTRDSMEE